MANQFLSLSLFLMLLSFFIVMNAVSQFDDSKSEPVISSVSAAFTNQKDDFERKNPVSQQTPVVARGEGDTLEAVEGLFNAHISGFQATRNRLGTVMHVRTTISQLERVTDMTNVDYNNDELGKVGSFGQTMVTLLRSEKKKQPYRVDILMNVPEGPATLQQTSPEEFKRSLKRVSHFAERLEESGLPKKMVSIGMKKGEEGYVDLFFYRYKAFDLIARLNQEKQRSGGR